MPTATMVFRVSSLPSVAMINRIPILLPILLLACAPAALFAQDSSDVTSAPSSGRESRSANVTFGVTSGAMRFADQRVQQGVTGVVRYHVTRAISLAVSPTYARVTFPTSLGGGAVNGLTDLPIELDADHSFPWAWSPTLGIALGSSMPVGDQQIGFGSGAVGASIGAGAGVSPTDALSMHLGVGKPLTDYNASSALGASGSMWSDAEVSYQLGDRVNATFGFDGDLASDDSLGNARAIALSVATTLAGPYTLTVSGGHGVSGPAARWTLALGIGTDFAGFEALGSSSPIQRFFRAMGGSSHRGSGSSNSGSGHGRGP
jgi:hypothetical protein